MDTTIIKQTLNGSSPATASASSLAAPYVLDMFNQRQDNRVVYHNYRFTAHVVQLVEQIGRNSAIPFEAVDIAATAGWFSAIGYHLDYANPIDKSLELAETFLYANKFNNVLILQILRSIETLKNPARMDLLENRLLNDAIQAVRFGKDYFEETPLLRAEMQTLLRDKDNNPALNDTDWTDYQIKNLSEAKFFTPFAKTTYEPLATQNLLKLKDPTRQENPTESGMANPMKEISATPVSPAVETSRSEPFSKAPKGSARNMSQTFFRTAFANHMHLSHIADNKAHLMISVNSVLLSILISGLAYKNLSQTHPMVLLPATVFILAGLTSLIFSVLSLRPKVTSMITTMPEAEQKKAIAFFGNFARLDYLTYERYMDEMLQSQKLIYSNMTQDLYYLGKVLDKKYRFLVYSYDIFMIGFAASTILYLFTILKDSL